MRGLALVAVLLVAGLLPAGGSPRAQLKDGEAFRECADCPQIAAVPDGKFVMGSPKEEPGRFDTEGPQHAVAVRRFALGVHEVTVEQFLQFLRESGYQPGPCGWPPGISWRSPGHGLAYAPGSAESPRQPAVCVSWDDAQRYIDWLNGHVRGLKQSAPPGAGPYRLPSEAEWEYAARAGSAAARWWGEEVGANLANCNGCGSRWDNAFIAPVGSFGPNPFGLYDMLGNVWQWVEDCWNDNYVGAPADGSPWMMGDCAKHVLRGGSWDNLPTFVRSAARSRGDATDRESDYASYAGFRVARSLQQ